MKYIEGIEREIFFKDREGERAKGQRKRDWERESAKSENCSAVMKNVDHN